MLFMELTGKKGQLHSNLSKFHYDIDPVIQAYPNLEGQTPENEAKMKIYQDIVQNAPHKY